MRMIPIRSMLITAASASFMLVGAPAFAQDTMQQPMQSSPQNNGMPGNMAPPAPDAMNKSYPVCRGGMTDNCQNPGEGGAPGRSRASDTKRGPAVGGMGLDHHHMMRHQMMHHKMMRHHKM